MENIEKLLKARSRTTWFGSVLILSVCIISALMIGQAQAGDIDILSLFTEGTNQASDENREYLIDRTYAADPLGPDGLAGTADDPTGVGVVGQLDEGDSLRGIVGINTLNSANANVGGTTGTNEWTGVFQIKVASKEEMGQTGSGIFRLTFEPDPDFETDLSGGIGVPNGFVPGPGAIIVMFEDSANNFALDFDDLSPATPPAGLDDGTPAPQDVPPSSADVSVGPYLTEEKFVALAVDGKHFWTLGFAGATGERFEANHVFSVGDNILPSFGITSASGILVFNAGLTRLINTNVGIGDIVSIAPVTPTIFGDLVQFAVSGSVRGVYDLDTPFEVSTNL
ncbi:MAG: hypothetical protein KAS86_00620, partial [Candidatus Omnitrophica bacterium]|nr:hypothetical protein [Candidatus Omnitrophota bacterium]